MIQKLRADVAKLTHSQFGQNIAWVTGLSVCERALQLIQTILIARALGITEYGVYGFLMSTIGLTASSAGMQLGFAATVFLARYKATNKAKARQVIEYVHRFALGISGMFFIASIPFAKNISIWLLTSDDYSLVVILGCIVVVGSVLSGLQDGVARGFEDFKAIALVNFIASILTLASIYPAAIRFGLEGVLIVLLGAIFFKFLLLNYVVRKHQQENFFPRRGSGLEFRKMILGFSVPSVLTGLVVGLTSWVGMYLLARQPDGFNGVAMINVGMQWRGPLMLVAASVGAVAIPIYSRMRSAEGESGAYRMQRKIMLYSGVVCVATVSVLIIFSESILTLYGPAFQSGSVIFSIVISSTVFTVLISAMMQKLVGEGDVWRSFYLHLPYVTLGVIGYATLIPMYQASGFAIVMFSIELIFLLYLGFFSKIIGGPENVPISPEKDNGIKA
jgi:O-antigen/teichoic acid export membrane protein